jgi:hypothetical protein
MRLTTKERRQIATIASKKDAGIDLTEMPEVTNWSRAEVGKFYRPKESHAVRCPLSAVRCPLSAVRRPLPHWLGG